MTRLDGLCRAGATALIRITKPDAIGRVVTYKLAKGKTPKPVTRCLPVGSSTPADTC